MKLHIYKIGSLWMVYRGLDCIGWGVTWHQALDIALRAVRPWQR